MNNLGYKIMIHNEAVRVAKLDSGYDNLSSEEKRELIAMLEEEFYYKYLEQ